MSLLNWTLNTFFLLPSRTTGIILDSVDSEAKRVPFQFSTGSTAFSLSFTRRVDQQLPLFANSCRPSTMQAIEKSLRSRRTIRRQWICSPFLRPLDLWFSFRFLIGTTIWFFGRLGRFNEKLNICCRHHCLAWKCSSGPGRTMWQNRQVDKISCNDRSHKLLGS